MRIKEITSFSNKIIKFISSLKDKKYSKQHNLFIAEGFEYIEKALKNNWAIEYLLYDNKATDNPHLASIIKQALAQKALVIYTKQNILQKITAKENSQNLIAINRTEFHDIEKLPINENCLALDNIKDAGNLGNIIRSSAAFAIKHIILIGDYVYPFSLEVIRATVGSIFEVKLYNIKQLNLLTKKSKCLIGTSLNATTDFRDIDYKNNNNIIILGNEKNGLDIDNCKICDILVKIPQSNEINSLNISSAATLLIFAAQQHKLSMK